MDGRHFTPAFCSPQKATASRKGMKCLSAISPPAFCLLSKVVTSEKLGLKWLGVIQTHFLFPTAFLRE